MWGIVYIFYKSLRFWDLNIFVLQYYYLIYKTFNLGWIFFYQWEAKFNSGLNSCLKEH